MNRLLFFELKKILQKRGTLFGLLFLLAFYLLMMVSTCRNMYTFDVKSGEEAHGIEAIRLDQKIARRYEGILTDEKVQEMLQDFKPRYDLHGMNVAYLYQNATQSAVHARFSDLNGDWNGKTVAEVFGKESIRIGYVNGWLNVSQSMIRVYFLLAFFTIFITAPVFSGEYNSVDSLILTTVHGKTICGIAKNMAAFLMAGLITICFSALNLVTAYLIYGSDGLNCSILFAPQGFTEHFIPFSMSCRELLFYQGLLAFVGILGITGITLFFSSLFRNQLLVLVLSAAIFALPIFLPVSENSSLFRLLVLQPVYMIQLISILSVEQSVDGVSYALWGVFVAILMMAIGYVGSCRVFERHEVV